MKRFFRKSIHQSWILVFFCMGVIIGVVLGLVFRINYFSSKVWMVLVAMFLIWGYFKPRAMFLIIALMMGMVVSFFRVSTELYGEVYVRQFYELNVKVEGVVKGDPETDECGTKFRLANLKFGDEKVESAGILYIAVAKNEELARGDVVILSGRLSEGFGTYVGYMYKPRIVKWERPEPGDLVLKMRNWFAERVQNLVPEPEVKLGLSYLMGMKAGLPDDLADNLRIVGLTHIVVASGAHLSILVEIARRIFGKISRFAGLLFSVLFVLFFMSMVGWTASILRAGVMAILTLFAWQTGRKIAPWRIILLVAGFTLILNPMFAIELSWQLSFASYAGIMMLGPGLIKYFYGEKKPGFIASTVLVTIAATMMTLPIVLYYYGQVSLISVIANLLILPTLPYAMGLVFLSGVTAGFPIIEIAIGFLATKLLDFHIVVVSFFGSMEQFLVKIPPNQAWMFLIYGVIWLPIMITWIKRLKQKRVARDSFEVKE